MVFEYVKRRRLHILSGQSVKGLVIAQDQPVQCSASCPGGNSWDQFLPIPLVPLLDTTEKIPQGSHKDEGDKPPRMWAMAELRAMPSDHNLGLQREKKLCLRG